MKKTLKLATISIIILLIATFLCAFTFDKKNAVISKASEKEVWADSFAPEKRYFQLTNPKFNHSAQNAIAVANENQACVISENFQYYIEDFLPPNSKIADIKILNNLLIVLSINGELNLNIQAIDFKSGGIEEIRLPDELLQNSITAIDTFGNQLLISDAVSIFLCDYSQAFSYTKIETTINVAKINGLILTENRRFAYSKDTVFDIGSNKNTISLNNASIDNIIFDGSQFITQENKKLTAYNQKGEKLSTYESDFTLSDLSFNDGKIFSCADIQNRLYEFDFSNNKFKTIDYFGDKGAELSRLNTPTDLSLVKNMMFIADSGNKRIVAVNLDTNEKMQIRLPSEIKYDLSLFCASEQGFALYDEQNNNIEIYNYNGLEFSLLGNKNVNNFGKILKMQSYGTDVIALTSSGSLIKINVNGIVELKYKANYAKTLSIPQDSENLYILFKTKIAKYHLESDTYQEFDLPNTQNIDYSGINIDFAGNLLLTYNNKIDCYKKLKIGYEYDFTTQVKNSKKLIQTTLHAYSGNFFAINDSGHQVLQLSKDVLDIISSTDASYNHPNQNNFDIIRAGTTVSNTTLMAHPSNTEAVRQLSNNKLFLALADYSHDGEEFYYGIVDGYDKLEYISKKDITLLPKNEFLDNKPTMTALLHSGAQLYKFPYPSAPLAEFVNNDVILTVENDIASESLTNGELSDKHIWKWYCVSYTSKDNTKITAYAKAIDVHKAKSETPTTKQYYKVKSERIGVGVTMYSQPSLDSEIIFESISDGTQVLIYQDYFNIESEFTRVKFDDKIGYILTAQLQKSGMTPNQIIALVVSCVSVVILAVAIALTILLLKRKQKKVA